MSDYTYLVGAEQVERAASTISGAASTIQSSASSFYDTAQRLCSALTDHAERTERALETFTASTPTIHDLYVAAALTALLGDHDIPEERAIKAAFRIADAAMQQRDARLRAEGKTVNA